MTDDPLKRGIKLGKMPKRRFEYRHLSGDDLAQMLRDADFAPNAFCRIFGTSPVVMQDWLADRKDIPTWVFPVLHVAATVDGVLGELRYAAGHHIVRDTKNPRLGEYPYRRDDAPADEKEDSA